MENIIMLARSTGVCLEKVLGAEARPRRQLVLHEKFQDSVQYIKIWKLFETSTSTKSGSIAPTLFPVRSLLGEHIHLFACLPMNLVVALCIFISFLLSSCSFALPYSLTLTHRHARYRQILTYEAFSHVGKYTSMLYIYCK